MYAEIISIGDELTSGQRLDTNSQWLSQRLGEIGITTLFHTTVADDLAANVAVFRSAIDRADVVIATGGLGPTADDLTREVIAECLGRPLVQDEAALQHIMGIFSRRGRDMPQRNKVQALFPAGSRVVPNPEGTAPGIDVEISRPGRSSCRLFALPGVPAEMFQMWQDTVAPALLTGSGAGRLIRHHRIKCFGVGESHLEQMLPDLIRRGRDPSVGITVHQGTITLRITAAGSSPDDCRQRMTSTEETICQCLSELIFGEEDDELEHAVCRLLLAQNRTLATCEAGTGGLIAHWLGELGEAASVYQGGLVVPSNASLTGALCLSADLLTEHSPASPFVAEHMAVHCRNTLQADYGLAITAFPAEAGGTYYVALATSKGVSVQPLDYTGHSAIRKPLAAKRALNLLRLHLLAK